MEHIGTGAMEPERNSEEIRLQARDMNMQGAMLLRAGRLEQARAKLDQAIELCPTLADSYKITAICIWRSKNTGMPRILTERRCLLKKAVAVFSVWKRLLSGARRPEPGLPAAPGRSLDIQAQPPRCFP